MAMDEDIGYVRLRVPKRVTPGEVIMVRVLVTHPMEGIERTAQGKVIERAYRFIYRVVVLYNDREVTQFEPSQNVSANPMFGFPLRVTEPGVLRVIFIETVNDRRYEASTKLEF